MDFKFVCFVVQEFIFLFSPGKEESEKFDVFSTLRQRLTFFLNTCSVCFLQLSLVPLYASRQTSRTLSPSPSDDDSLYLFFMPPWRHTCHLVNSKKKNKTRRGRRGKKKTCFSHETPLALSLSLSEAFVRLFQEGETLAGCTAGSRLSAVLGNHLSLYWFRCLSLSVSVCHAFCR